MALIFMPQYLVAVAVAVVGTLIAKRAGLHRSLVLWLLATIIIIACRPQK